MSCCNHEVKFDGVSDDYKRRIIYVIILNFVMFIVEITSGHLAGSQALQADALDFLGDTLTYGLSLIVIGKAISVRANVALAKGVSLFLMGAWVLASTCYQFFVLGVPNENIMGVIGFMALFVNLLSVMILARYKDGDANVRSVWLCSRNDAISNVAVIIAAIFVGLTHTAWPDLIVAIIMAALFISSSIQIIKQALEEKKQHSH